MLHIVWITSPSFQEHQVGRSDLVIDDVEMKHTVYVYKCEKCTLQIKGKVNSITLGNYYLILQQGTSWLRYKTWSIKRQMRALLDHCNIFTWFLDSCKKTGVVFNDVVSGLEFVNCQSVQAQVSISLCVVFDPELVSYLWIDLSRCVLLLWCNW